MDCLRDKNCFIALFEVGERERGEKMGVECVWVYVYGRVYCPSTLCISLACILPIIAPYIPDAPCSSLLYVYTTILSDTAGTLPKCEDTSLIRTPFLSTKQFLHVI